MGKRGGYKRGNYERERVPAEPFLEWFESYARRQGMNQKEAACKLGIGAKLIQRAKFEGVVGVNTVDRALLYASANLRDLYPDLYADD